MAAIYLCSLILLVPLAIAEFDQIPDSSEDIVVTNDSYGTKLIPELEAILARSKRGTGRFNDFYEYLVKLGLNKICRLLRIADIEDRLTSLGSFTLFAPTDEAFALLPGGVIQEIESSPEKLRDFISYHITQGLITSKRIRNDVTVPSIMGRPLRFNVYVTDKGQVLSVSGGQILTADQVHDRSVVHILDRVLYPSPTVDISTVARWTHDSLYRHLVSAGLANKLSDGVYTLLAPSNDAFKGLPQTARELLQKNTTLLSNILLNHIIPGAVFTTGLYDGLTLTSLGGVALTFTFKRGLILVNGIPIVEPDIPATNGVIHLINRVLVPKQILEDCRCLPETKIAEPSVVREPSLPSRGHPTLVPTSILPHVHHITIYDHHRPVHIPDEQQRIDEPGSKEEPSDSYPKKPPQTEPPFGQRRPTVPYKPHKPVPATPLLVPSRRPSPLPVQPTTIVLPSRHHPPVSPAEPAPPSGQHRLPSPSVRPSAQPHLFRPTIHHTFSPSLPPVSRRPIVQRPHPETKPEIFTTRRPSPQTFPTRPQLPRVDYHRPTIFTTRRPTTPTQIYVGEHHIPRVTTHHIDIISPVAPHQTPESVLQERTRPDHVPARPTTTTPEPELPITILRVFEKPELVFDQDTISLTIIYKLFEEVGLTEYLLQPGPLAVFVPSDDVFAQLPEETLKELRDNPDLLHQVLLYHTITVPPPPFGGAAVHPVRTAQGLPALVRYDENGRIIQFNGADVVISRGIDQDHVIYVITSLLYPLPKPSINAYLSSRRDLYRYFTYLIKSTADDVIKGPELFTLFLPSDEAFNDIPRHHLDQILNNRTVLEDFLLSHIVRGVYFTKDLPHIPTLSTLRRGELRFQVSPGGVINVNGADIIEPDIVTGNGVIHVIERLAYVPPYFRPAPSAPPTTVRVPSTRRPVPSHVTTTFDLTRPGRPTLTPRPRPIVSDPHHVVDHHIVLNVHPVTEYRHVLPTTRTLQPVPTTPPPATGLRPEIDVTLTEILQKPEIAFANQPFSISVSYDLFRRAGLIDSLSTKGPFTIFVPTDEALDILPPGQLDSIRGDTEKLRDVLLYHVIATTIPQPDSRTTYMVTTAGGKPILLTCDDRGQVILVDGAEVLASKIGNNGVIYVITRLLYPLPEKSIVDFLETRGQLSTTLKYLVEAGLERMFKGPEPFTFFAPSNEAYKQLHEEELHHLLHNKTALERFILNHAVGGIHYVKEFQPSMILPTPRGSILRFRMSPTDGQVSVNGANIIEGDITTGTGVVHVVDSVIRTSPEVKAGDKEAVESVIVVPSSIDYGRNSIADLARGMRLNKFIYWLETTGLLPVIQDGKSYTIFAPTDEAISSLPGLQKIEENIDQLRLILKYHITPVYIQSGQVKDEELVETLLDGKKIRLNIYQDGKVYTASGAPFAPPSNRGNVLIAAIDRVLFPPQGDIYVTTSKLSILKDLKEALEISGLQDLLQGTGPFTFFAPSNEAFKNLPPQEREKLLSDPEALLGALKRHIVKGQTVYTSGITEGLKLKSATDEDLTLSIRPTCVAVDGINIVYPDITAYNGVIHVIDHFL